MKKLTLISSIAVLGFSHVAVAENIYISKYLEQGLIKICKTAAQDKVLPMKKSIDALNLRTKTVALNVVCNGQDIISFAERYGAQKTTARLSNSIGRVEVTDIAALGSKKYDVTFKF